MGAIYEVIHVETRRRRALKVMLPDLVANRDMHARFKLEATRVAAEVESEHVVETFDAGVDYIGALFLVMELLPRRGSGQGFIERGRALASRSTWWPCSRRPRARSTRRTRRG